MARILIVETDRQLASILKDYLTNSGHKVDVFADPQKAVRHMDKKSPDVIVMDFMLAGRSGVEFLYELRSYPEWLDLPVILMSHLSEDELANFSTALEQLRINRYLSKSSLSLSDVKTEIEQTLQLVT